MLADLKEELENMSMGEISRLSDIQTPGIGKTIFGNLKGGNILNM